MDIYAYNGIQRLTGLPIAKESTRRFELGKEDYIKVKFSLVNYTKIETGDYIDCEFGRFYATEDYTPTLNDKTGGYDYDVTFENQYRIFKNHIIKYSANYNEDKNLGEASWSLTSFPSVFATIIKNNIDALCVFTWKNGNVYRYTRKQSPTTGDYCYSDKDCTQGKEAITAVSSSAITTASGTFNYQDVPLHFMSYNGTGYASYVILVQDEFNDKGITLSFQSSSILDAIIAVAQAMNDGEGVDWFVDEHRICFGQAEKYDYTNHCFPDAQGYVTPSVTNICQDNRIPVWIGNGNIRYTKTAFPTTSDKCYTDAKCTQGEASITQATDMSIRSGGVTYTRMAQIINAESISISDSKSDVGTRIIPFGSTINISKRYRKELRYTINSVTDSGDYWDITAKKGKANPIDPRYFSADMRAYTGDVGSKRGTQSLGQTIILAGTSITEKLNNDTVLPASNYTIGFEKANLNIQYQSVLRVYPYTQGATASKVRVKVSVLAGSIERASQEIELTNYGIGDYYLTIDNLPQFTINTDIDGKLYVVFTVFVDDSTGTWKVDFGYAHESGSAAEYNITWTTPKYSIDGVNLIVTKNGTQYASNTAVVNPQKVTISDIRAQIIRFPKSAMPNVIPAINDTFTITNILRGLVPFEYFISQYDSEVKYGVVATNLMLPNEPCVQCDDKLYKASEFASYAWSRQQLGITFSIYTKSATPMVGDKAYGEQMTEYGTITTISANSIVINSTIFSRDTANDRGTLVYNGQGYVDIKPDLDQSQVREKVIVFDSVYPTYASYIKKASYERVADEDEDGEQTGTFTYYWTIVDAQSDVLLNKDMILDNQDMQIVFGTVKKGGTTYTGGLLNGMTFGIKLLDEYKDTSHSPVTKHSRFKIVPTDEYGQSYPNDVMYPAINDGFNIVNIDASTFSSQLEPQAEMELLRVCLEYIKDITEDKKTYTAKMMSNSVSSTYGNFKIGTNVRLIGGQFGSGKVSRVLGVEYKLDIPYDTPTLIIGKAPTYSRLGAMEEKINGQKYKGATIIGGSVPSSSGGGSGQSIYIIQTNDSTAPSDANVFSAKRTLAELAGKANSLHYHQISQVYNLSTLLGGLRTDVDTANSAVTGVATALQNHLNSQTPHSSFIYNKIEVDAKDNAIKDLRGTSDNFGMVKVDGTSIVSENGVLSATKKHIQLVVKETADYDSELFVISNHLLDDELADIRIARKGKWTVRQFGTSSGHHDKRGYRCMKGNQTDSEAPYYKLKITAEYYTWQCSMFPNGERMHIYRLKVTNKNDITQSVPLTSGNLLEWFVFEESTEGFCVKNGKKPTIIGDCDATDRSIHTIHFGIGINGGTTILPFDIKIRSYMFKASRYGGRIVYRYRVWNVSTSEYEWETGGFSNFCDLVVI